MTKKDIKKILLELKEILTMKVEMNGVLEQKLPKQSNHIDNALSKTKL